MFRIFKTMLIPNHKSWRAEILRECSPPHYVRCQVSGVRCHMLFFCPYYGQFLPIFRFLVLFIFLIYGIFFANLFVAYLNFHNFFCNLNPRLKFELIKEKENIISKLLVCISQVLPVTCHLQIFLCPHIFSLENFEEDIEEKKTKSASTIIEKMLTKGKIPQTGDTESLNRCR